MMDLREGRVASPVRVLIDRGGSFLRLLPAALGLCLILASCTAGSAPPPAANTSNSGPQASPAPSSAVVTPYLKIEDQAVLRHGLDAMVHIIDPDLDIPLDDLRTILQTTAATVPEVANPRPEELIDLSLLDDIKAEGYIDRLYGR